MKSIRCVAAAAFAAVFCIHAGAANFYVTLSGDDGNDGLAPDAEHALRTVEVGVAKARDYILANPEDTVTVNVGEGEFALGSVVGLHARTSLKGAGRAKTILNAVSLVLAKGSAVSLTNALSSVESLTITNGVPKGVAVADKVRCLSMSDGRVADCRITGGQFAVYNGGGGGGINMTGGVVTNCVIDHCSATAMYTRGGGIYVNGGEIVDCEFFANKTGTGMWEDAANAGSAVHLIKGTVRRCYIHDNGEAGQFQLGAVSMGMNNQNNPKILENCLIVNNQGKGRTTLYLGSEQNTVRYCTISGNATGSGCVYLKKWYKNELVNNIIWGNASETVADVVLSLSGEGSWTFKSNLLTRAISGREAANFTGDPLFVDARTGNYRLGSRSSAAYGRALPVAAVTTDYVLKPRDATAPSIGAYEYDPSATPLALNVTIDKVYLKGEARASATVVGADDGEYEVEWFLDDEFAGTGLSVTFPDADYGTHGVRAALTTTDGRTTGFEDKNAFTVRTGVAYVNKFGNGTYPYDSPQTGTNDIAEALSAVWSGGKVAARVLVDEGMYVLPSKLTVGRARVIGAGREKTILNAVSLVGKGGSAVSLTNGLSSVESLTISNGVPAGVKAEDKVRCLSMAAGRVTDCRITGGQFAVYNGGGGAGIYMTGGVVSNSVIDHCTLSAMYTRGGGVYVKDGEIVDCEFHSNTISYNAWEEGSGATTSGSAIFITKGAVRRCFIHDNGTDGLNQFGAVAMGAGTQNDAKVLENCMIVNNRGNACSALYVSTEQNAVRYCTIAGNSTGSGCVRIKKWYKNEFVDNIIWGNASETVPDVDFYVDEAGKSTFASNLVTRAISGRETLNFTGDPLFVDLNAGDCHLGSRSSAAYGRAAPIAAVTTDYALNPRDAVAPSIGAYEYDPSAAPLLLNVTVEKPVCLKGQASAFASVIGVEEGEYEVEWFLDGVSAGKGVTMTFSTADYGVHDVKTVLTTTDGRSKTVEIDEAFTVRTDTVYVNNFGNGTYPYGSPETGTNDIVEAMSAVWMEGTAVARVLVDEGAFALPSKLSIGRAKVVGAGRGKTILTAVASGTSVQVGHSRAVLSDLTVADGRAGRAVSLSAGTVCNCVITNFQYTGNFGDFSGMGMNITGGLVYDTEVVDCVQDGSYCVGGGVFMNGTGVMSNCVVRNCSAQYRGEENNGYAGGGLRLESGTVVNTVFTGCGSATDGQDGAAIAMKNGVVRGCVIDRCVMPGGSPRAIVRIGGGTFESCTVAANTNGAAAVAVSAGTVRNTVVHGNVTTAQLVQNGGTVTYCCYAEATEGVDGNRTPKGRMFRNLSRRDFHPIYGSPCLDSGSNQGWMTGATDLTGAPRIIHDIVDIGALESNPPGLLLLVY